jgi:phospholipid/cholesterol/gamma-HCH transport system substrate-binding protein
VKRSNEFAVGLAVIVALALIIGGALWLSETDINQKETRHSARFRTVGGLGVGGPVTLRGVKVGRVEAIRLAENEWVEADFTIERGVELPASPAVVAASASLFGEWSASIIPLDPLPDDPIVRGDILAAQRQGGDVWPGATLPDIGQLTAQASRIAGDVGDITQRVRGVFDSAALSELRQSVLDLAAISNRLVTFTTTQTGRLDQVGRNIATTSDAFAHIARSFDNTVARIDTATNDNQLRDILNNSRATSGDLRASAADLRSVMAAARSNEASLVRVIQSADSLMQKIQSGQGTLGLLATDSALYQETTLTMRQFRELLADVQAHPRKYIKISVF